MFISQIVFLLFTLKFTEVILPHPVLDGQFCAKKMLNLKSVPP